jgi:YD repeat-containing protein
MPGSVNDPRVTARENSAKADNDGENSKTQELTRRKSRTDRIESTGKSRPQKPTVPRTYNARGMVTSRIDPVGQQTNYTYATNGLDLLQLEQLRSGGTDIIQQYSDYNSQHPPGTITDAAGQDTDITYNSVGQSLTVTNAKNETTTYTYETASSAFSPTLPWVTRDNVADILPVPSKWRGPVTTVSVSKLQPPRPQLKRIRGR